MQTESDWKIKGSLNDLHRDHTSSILVTTEYEPIRTGSLSLLEMYEMIKERKVFEQSSSRQHELLHVMDYPAEKYHNSIRKVMENFIREANRERLSQETYHGREIIDVDALSESGTWFDVVLQKIDMIRNYLYYLAGVPIIDAPWRLKLNAQ